LSTNDTVRDVLVSDNEGYLYLPKPAGKYSVKVSRKSYKSTEMRGINISENSTKLITLE
jgi:hypothetical protein